MVWLKLLLTRSPEPCTIISQSSAGKAPNTVTELLPDGDFVGVKVALKDWQLEYFAWMHFSSTYFFITSTLIQHLVLNRMNKQDSSPQGTSRLTDRHTQIIPLHAVQFCWVLTDTSQQQLYPKQNRENNNESDACRFITIFCLCRAAIAAHSGCSSILLPQFNSCPLIYIPNLATIKIPRLLVNSLSLSRSTSHP